MESVFSVLLIDDNAIDGMIHSKVLEKSALSDVVYTSQSAIGALDLFKNLGKVKTSVGHNLLPKYVFLDLDMPIMDGFQFMKSFDKLDDTIKQDVKIVILTASDKAKDQEYPQQFKNFHRYMMKPLTLEKIESL